MDIVEDSEMLKITEIDPMTLNTTTYTIKAEEVTSIINPFDS